MKVTPVKEYARPGFPTRRILDEHPEMLRLVPERWQRNPAVLAALAGVCVLIAGSRALAADNGKKTPPTRIAPIFQHGDGRGAFGCEVINPPVFLSEDEAREVIVQEGKRVGIGFVPDSRTLQGIAIPSTDRYQGFRGSAGASTTARPRIRPLLLDGTDAKLRISYEYVSEKDFGDWEQSHGMAATAYTVDTLGAARNLQKGLVKARPSGAYGVFYDPMTKHGQFSYKTGMSDSDSQAEYSRLNAEALGKAREELRKQVRDFIVWLKAQGVI